MAIQTLFLVDCNLPFFFAFVFASILLQQKKIIN